MTIKPCPFCGHIGLEFSAGSTFRWIIASCGGCGATAGETRIQTLGNGTKDEWMANAQADAIKQWNAAPHPLRTDMDERNDDEYALDLGWHALNYRCAKTEHAELFWRELEACVQRIVDAATTAERERCAKVCDIAAANSYRNDGFDDAFEGGLHWQASRLAAAIRNYPNQDKSG